MTAYLALMLWPLISIAFFRWMSLAGAVAATIIGGYLLLPERTSFNLPLLPVIDKHTVPALTALVGVLIILRKRPDLDVQPGWLPKHTLVRILLLLLFIGIFGTVLTNRDPIFASGAAGPALRLYDAFSELLRTFMVLIPFLIARKVLTTPSAMRDVIIVLTAAAVGYACFALVEIRLSPQMSNWVYGFFPHSWRQHLRDGGFRPVVFLNHGLWLAIFFATALTAAAALAKSDVRLRPWFIGASCFIFVTLALSKNLGALVIACAMLALIFVMPRRLQLLAAACIAGMVLTYPMLRALDIVPVRSVVSVTAPLFPERAASLGFRLMHEDALLARAMERPVFGWGGWGRNLIFDEQGRNTSITDGLWVIHFGQRGWVGYLTRFGLMTAGIILIAFRRRSDIDAPSAALALALAANLVDLLPNAGSSPITWLMAGALIGRLDALRRTSGAEVELPTEAHAERMSGRQSPVLRREFPPPPHRDGLAPARTARHAMATDTARARDVLPFSRSAPVRRDKE